MLIMSLSEQPNDGTFAYNEGPLLRKTKWTGPLLRKTTECGAARPGDCLQKNAAISRAGIR